MYTDKKVIWSPVKDEDIKIASQQLLQGELIGLPTETVYGLAADAENFFALNRLFQIKGRPVNHPVIVHVAFESDISYWVKDINLYAKALMKFFWPGPLTLLFQKQNHVLDLITGGQKIIGLRSPAHPIAQRLIKKFAQLKKNQNAGLAAPSANYFGRISPTKANHVFEDFNGAISVLDGGECSIGIESTIVDVSSSDKVVILRPGKISKKEIFAVLEKEGLTVSQHNELDEIEKKFFSLQSMMEKKTSSDKVPLMNTRVSGLLPSHYAPKTLLYLLNTKEAHISWYINQLLAFKDAAFFLSEFDDKVLHSKYQPLLTPIHELIKGAFFGKRIESIALVLTKDTYNQLFLRTNSYKERCSQKIFHYFHLPKDPNILAFHLYDLLRKLDDGRFQQIWFEWPIGVEEYLAIDDRLRRAAKMVIG